MIIEILAPQPERLKAAADFVELTRLRVEQDLIALVNFCKRHGIARPQRAVICVNHWVWG